jgi:hypothetical protein
MTCQLTEHFAPSKVRFPLSVFEYFMQHSIPHAPALEWHLLAMKRA